MVDWKLSNSGPLLEKIRSALGGTERPNQLHYYTGVMPVLEIGSYIGAVRELATDLANPTNQSFLVSSMTGYVAGEKYRPLAVSARITVAGGAGQLNAVIFDPLGQGGTTPVGQVNVGNSANNAVGYVVGGEFVNAYIFDGNSQLGVECPVAFTVSANVHVNLIVQVLPQVT